MKPALSVMLTSFPLAFEDAVARAAALGFTHVDVVALADRPASHREALADSGLLVSCASLGRDLPTGSTLDAAATDQRRAALEIVKRQITDAAQLGATCCYVVPGTDATPDALMRFADTCRMLAEYAAGRMMRLCVEPTPGRALPSAMATLAWLEQAAHPNLALLLDVGHCLISGEDAADVVRSAAQQLGYVHLDDNDGQGDLHWPLLQGRLTEEQLTRTLQGLRTGLALEFNPGNADPERAVRDGKALIERLWNAPV